MSILVLCVFTFLQNAQTATVPKKCYQAPFVKKCDTSQQRRFFYFDSKTNTCERYQTCGPAYQGKNIFPNEMLCNLHCKSPAIVSNDQCLVDFGPPSSKVVPGVMDWEWAVFNPQAARCIRYSPLYGGKKPRRFKDALECRDKCLKK
ncbi:hypothetical protein RF11_00087 [Thelohanellus kitauei]|uniref:Uncharacterized protein n=1 Tax=Thelohanellus kitauei TaxID=669202 RepID=A0A0C2J6P9_THEKT|nr:hypothetical protein RF11_00087 [Thelohanellus kitauei]